MDASSFEVEVKIPIKERSGIEKALLTLGFELLGKETQIDDYYDHPCKSFQLTDEALRLRHHYTEESEDKKTLPPAKSHEITYKGAKIDPKSKTRIELSLDINDSDTAQSILECLGFKFVASVQKRRIFYSKDRITASIDDVDEVGQFLELEIQAESFEEVEPSRDCLLNLMRKIGLNPDRSTRKSYLELLLSETKI